MKLVGVDRARGVWLVAESNEQLGKLTLGTVEELTDYLQSLDGADCRVVIDVPIGLPETTERPVDKAARRLVGPKRTSSIFPVPMRAALPGRTDEEASALNFGASGKKLTRQTYAILDGIRELDAFMTPDRQCWIREGHPEVTFAMLSDEHRGVLERKKTPEGENVRVRLLSRCLSVPDIDQVRVHLGRGRAGRDDVIDALAMLVSAHRWLNGESVLIPADGVDCDERGLRMEMVA